MSFAFSEGVERRNGPSDELGALLERLDDVRRQSERARSYASEGLSRRPFYPERRRHPRIAEPSGSEGDNNSTA